MDATQGEPDSPSPGGGGGWLASLDQWMAEHPWHPRVTPFMVYLLFLMVISAAADAEPMTYPFLYGLQAAVVGGMLWRYRALTPELNLRFHWLAIPVGLAIAAAWVGLGLWMVQWQPDRFAATDKHLFEKMEPAWRWVSLSMRLVGMSLLVPLFEELFIRSLMLRSLSRPRRVGVGLVQVVSDFPVVGDWLTHTSWGRRADRHVNLFATEFHETPLGKLTWFGVLASTFVFMLGHGMRDWPGVIVCGVAYCLLLTATRHKGLGPVVWAHGITNAALWIYTVRTGDWQFL